jgi:hypothetical protein
MNTEKEQAKFPLCVHPCSSVVNNVWWALVTPAGGETIGADW